MVLSMGDRFYSLIDGHDFSDSLLWRPEPVVEDPVDFVASGVHTDSARLLGRNGCSCRACQHMCYIGSGIRYGLRSENVRSSMM